MVEHQGQPRQDQLLVVASVQRVRAALWGMAEPRRMRQQQPQQQPQQQRLRRLLVVASVQGVRAALWDTVDHQHRLHLLPDTAEQRRMRQQPQQQPRHRQHNRQHNQQQRQHQLLRRLLAGESVLKDRVVLWDTVEPQHRLHRQHKQQNLLQSPR